MEVAALACLLSTEPTKDVSEQTNGDKGFGAIFNRTLGTGKNGKTAQKKNPQQEQAEDGDQSEDAGSQMAALLMPGMVGLTVGASGVDSAAVGQADAQAIATELPMLQPEVQAEIATQPAATGTEQFVAMVVQQLDKAGQEIQSQRTALQTDASSLPQQTNVDSAVDPAAVTPTDVGAVQEQETNPQPILPAEALMDPPKPQQSNSGDQKKPAEGVTAADTEVSPVQTTAVSAAQNAEANPGDASSDSGGMEKSIGTEKGKTRSTEKSEPTQTVSSYAHLMASKTDREADLTQLQEAVNRAMDQFETDFQSFKLDGSTIRIALEPKELGSVSIMLSAGLNGVTAKIQTDNKDAASLISNQVQRMIQAMETKGVRVDSVEVACNQFSQQNFSGGGNQYQRQTPTFVPLQTVSRQESGPVAGSYDSVAEQYTPSDGVGQRVEYRI